MKRINFYLLILLSISSIFAQDIDLKWSSTEETFIKSPEPITIGVDEEDILILKGKDIESIKDYWIDIFKKSDFSLKLKINFSDPQFKTIQDNYIQKITYTDKTITIFSVNQYEEKLRLIGTIINSDGTILELSKELGSINNMNKKNEGSFTVLSNVLKDKYLIYTNLPTQRKENEQLNYKIIDNKLKVFSDKKITLPYRDDLFYSEGTMMDSKGNVYLTGTKYETKSDRRQGNGTAIIFTYAMESGEFNELKFPITHNVMYGYKMSFDNDNNIKIEGKYKDHLNKEGDKYNEGIFSLIMDVNTGKIIYNNFWKVDKSIIPKEFSRYYDLNEYIVRYIFDNSETKKTAILEYGGITTRCDDYTCTENTQMGDVLILRLDINGKVESCSVAPKNQSLLIDVTRNIFIDKEKRNAKYRALTSFTLLYKDDIYLIYNDHPKNLSRTLSDYFKQTSFGSETASYIASINKDGIVKREILFKKKDENGFLIIPGNSVQISDSEVLVFANQKKNKLIKFGIFKLNNK